MKTVIPLSDRNFITRKQVLENIKQNNGVCYFQLCCDWEDCGYDRLNYLLDEEVDNGQFLCDVTYKPIKINKDTTLVFEVCSADTQDYIDQCKEEGECEDID